MKLICKTTLAVAVTAAFAAGAQANTITGSVWEVSPGVAEEATFDNIPNTAPTVTWTANSTGLNFNSSGANGAATYYTIGAFLGTGGATITSGANHANDTVNNTIWKITGEVTMTHGQTYNTEHDDGLTLIVGGVAVVNKPDPTAPSNTPYTWTGATGTYSFELVYTENSGAPGVLITTLPLTSAPDGGATGALLGGSLAMLGFVARRVRK